ncbi:hypothetical protein C9374_012587 [Naegleria lovaniensis]|uniref:SAM domain-containing protein n=1 Tax=Naegleria lovaniensis TaxID=51637 RepID=A0AA88KW57_NAELO|nr:uncharacterized protein C9374_012587 [Naegleria lovaniensis]KAG2392335.1 hypothetical protein C9374_012587 [Naegleria lovaniensis]
MERLKSLFKSTREQTDLESKPLEEWSTKDFQDWLKEHDYQKKVLQILKKEEWNGKCLVDFTEEDLKKIGIPSGSAKGITNSINVIKQEQIKAGILNSNLSSSKLTTTTLRTSDSGTNDNTTTTTSSDSSDNMNGGDNSTTVQVVQLLDATEEEEEEQEEKKTPTRQNNPSRGIFNTSSASESTAMPTEERYVACPPFQPSTFTEQDKKDYDKCMKKVQLACQDYPPSVQATICQDCIFVDRFQYRYFNPLRLTDKDRVVNKMVEPFIKVKLVITEMDTGMAHRLLRSIGSRIHKTIKAMDYGMFHTALIVGVYYIEWVDSSLVTVRKKSSSKAVFATDIGTISGQEKVNDAFFKLSELICDWNRTRQYDNKTANCQHFCTEAIEKLGLSDAFEKIAGQGPLKEYLTRLKTTGACDMSYRISQDVKETILQSDNAPDELKEFLNTSGNALTFHSHKILDQFVHILQEEDPLYFDREPFDYVLLKAYDRAFWLRSQSKGSGNDSSHYWTNPNTGACMCPFNKSAANVENEEIVNSIIGKDFELGTYRPNYPVRLD